MRGIDTAVPDSLLIMRAREALAAGSLDAVTLLARVCALPGAPPRVAERLAEALFSRHAEFRRDLDGRWGLADGGSRESSSGATPASAPLAPASSTPGSREAESSGRADRRGNRVAECRDGDDVPLSALNFAVVDVETTGTSPLQRDRVTEIAIVQVTGGVVSDCYETLVNPERPIPAAIVALTRITQEMVRGAPPFPQVAADVVGRLRDRIFVAHNASFDWRFVSHEVRRAAGVTLTGETLCTVRLARVLLPHLPRRNLDSVTHHFGIDIGARHRAAGDALATAHVLLRLLQLAESRGATTWHGLSALLRGGSSRATRRRSAMPRGVDIDPTI